MESFLPVPLGSDFPLHNLPWGVFSVPGLQGSSDEESQRKRIGVAIGESVVDVSALAARGLLSGRGGASSSSSSSSSSSLSSCLESGREGLNPFLALGRPAWSEARRALTSLLRSSEGAFRDDEGLRKSAVFDLREIKSHLPMRVGDYTDFYASKEHATNCGCLFRGLENALQPNWTSLPVGYHGRSSSIVVSGTDVRRPRGQLSKGVFGPSKAVDFELEVGAVLGGPSNRLGESVELAAAADRIFGYCLLNDWSARDVQSWEMVPLGPFNGKNWATTVSAWIVSAEAVEPWRTSSVPQEDPRPLPYLDEEAANLRGRSALDVSLEVEIKTSSSSSAASPSAAASPSPSPSSSCCPGCVVSRSNARHLYWSFPQMIAHHSAGGCPLLPGDLLGSGTVSAPGGAEAGGLGCLLEMTRAGREPLTLACGATRTYLEDGDEVVLRGRCEAREGEGEGLGGIGWGEARGKLLPAAAL